MKSSMVAALGSLAVLGKAQQPASRDSPDNHTVATIAIVNAKPNTRPIVIPVPTTVVSHDGATVTMEKWATAPTIHLQQSSSIHPWGDRRPVPGPPRRPHGSVQPYYPGEDTTKSPPFIIDPMNACARGYSCQPEYEREHHGGTVHRVGDDCRGGHCKRENDGDCLGGCDTESAADAAEKWSAPPGCRKLCGGGKCWDDCDDRTVLPKPVCPIGFSCQRKRHKVWEPPSSSSSTTSSRRTRSYSSVPPAPAPAVPTPVVPSPVIVTSFVPVPIAPAPGAPSPVPPPPYYPSPGNPAPGNSAPGNTAPGNTAPGSTAPGNPAPTAPVAAPSAAQTVQPHRCPAGQHPCPHRYGNGTVVPPAAVTMAGASYMQPVAGVVMVVAGVFGLLMA
ncbi:hypothetical protein VSDG_05421 [Cytospora chrysosperma]|uniref:Uncharacterized protein n=1 Tax=Cytospora chrysosperma TaxID=252740 RepID=A0A423VZL8_CYTCH|nr:hypothetical protein VSDG_05421 [Valsa sordida]